MAPTQDTKREEVEGQSQICLDVLKGFQRPNIILFERAGEGDPVDSRLRSIEIITVPGSVFRFPDWEKWTLNFEPPISNGSEQGGMVWKIQKI